MGRERLRGRADGRHREMSRKREKKKTGREEKGRNGGRGKERARQRAEGVAGHALRQCTTSWSRGMSICKGPHPLRRCNS
eukprot:1434431-Pleurochrysis_carterae.AAC.1